MTALSLAGLTVLVIEDDYYLADDARAALSLAGSRVLGPFGRAAEAMAAADLTPPDCALVDINLGDRPDFAPARALLARGVPIIFVTGYDEDVIPADLRGATCLQKPASGQKIVEAVADAAARH